MTILRNKKMSWSPIFQREQVWIKPVRPISWLKHVWKLGVKKIVGAPASNFQFPFGAVNVGRLSWYLARRWRVRGGSVVSEGEGGRIGAGMNIYWNWGSHACASFGRNRGCRKTSIWSRNSQSCGGTVLIGYFGRLLHLSPSIKNVPHQTLSSP